METIRKSTLEFLKKLKTNNNRDWFYENKPLYIEAKDNYEAFVREILDNIVEFEPIMKGLEIKSCTYRINRDIRFTNDKSPYKSHLGAYIVRGGKQNGDRYAGYYFHIEPGNNSMIAGGAYIPPAPWLALIRERIDEEGNRLVKILNDPEFLEFFGGLDGEKLKSAPRGFVKDHPHIELLKMKSFMVARSLSDKEVTSEKCLETVIKAARLMKPLNDFLNGGY